LGSVKCAGLTIPKTLWKRSPEECIEMATEEVFSSVEGRTFHDWTLVSIVPLGKLRPACSCIMWYILARRPQKLPTLFTDILWLCVKWIQTGRVRCFST